MDMVVNTNTVTVVDHISLIQTYGEEDGSQIQLAGYVKCEASYS